MGDPLSIAASVAGLLSLGLQSAEYLYKFYSTYRGQDDDLARAADKLDGLVGSLQELDELLRTRKWRRDEINILQNVEKSITRCEDVINELRDEASKFKKEPLEGLKKRLATTARRVAYPFRRSTIEKLDEDVGEFRENLTLALQILQLKDHAVIKDTTEELLSIIRKGQAQDVSADVRNWLKAADATVDFNAANSKRHPGTGQWLVQGPIFTNWLSQKNSFLWLYGFAGCGKSVLCSTTIQYAQRHQQAHPRTAIAYFFFTFRDATKQDASAALRALLLQLCGQIKGLEADLLQLKNSYDGGTPPVNVLEEHLKRAILRCQDVYILLDALDESPADNSREEVLLVIERIRKWQLPGLHLLVTSRDLLDIRDGLQFYGTDQDWERVWLNKTNVQQDITNYVSYMINHDRKLLGWNKEQREKIKICLVERASGV